ncbi:FecCD family ABC transporter permease [Salinicoccus halitifaciens]|uniref:Iron complex transport system permease protein n=1 Tax=Salinicoccus halitifaciens TaxID=1073415 RepID=A0ABV2EAS6_9STAP|nr:iron ABC transporter permease [Salinicoccus halitifaciens]MCD2137644.1 iron ABC transporter permease [Salinicoccus halitifaciens]
MAYLMTIIISFILLASAFILSLVTGSVELSLRDAVNAFIAFDPSDNGHIIIREVRAPRAAAAAIAGAAFAVAGAVMQAVTRNPLAEPGIIGLNAGALFFLTIAFIFMPGLPFTYLIIISFAGALFSALIVLTVSFFGRAGMSPLKLILAGVAVTLFFAALSTAFQLYFNIGQDIAFWFAGAIQTIGWGHLSVIIPWFLFGIALSLVLSPVLTAISFDEETAVSLGVPVNKTRLSALIAVVMLAGLGVSIIGAAAFIGLIVPHMARFLSGGDYRWILPLSGVLGAVLTVCSDLAARTLAAPVELPAGALIALIGVPFFLYLARRVVHYEV